jgi:hypothetical protein
MKQTWQAQYFPFGNKVQFEKKLAFCTEYKKSFLVI